MQGARRALLCWGSVVLTALVSCGDYIIPGAPRPRRKSPTVEEEAGPDPIGEPTDSGAGDAEAIAWEPPPYTTAPVVGNGHAIFLHPIDRKFRRVEARLGATPEILDTMLDRISPGEDTKMGMSRDGNWLVIETSRFGCGEDSCVGVMAGDLSRGERVTVRGVPLGVGASTLAIGGEGRLIVYGTGAGQHTSDLFSIVKTARGWSDPRNLTASSPFDANHRPNLSPDSRRAVFDCGPDPTGAEGTAICEVAVDGTGFRVLRRPAGLKNLHNPAYSQDGTIVIEHEDREEKIWRMDADGVAYSPINPEFGNDNTPCVLPNGNILSLFLRRPGNQNGDHELKMMTSKGQIIGYLQIQLDIVDIGNPCGN